MAQDRLTTLILSLCCDAQLYLLDEPFGGIDIKTRAQMKHLLLDRLSPENTFVIATLLSALALILQGEALGAMALLHSQRIMRWLGRSPFRSTS